MLWTTRLQTGSKSLRGLWLCLLCISLAASTGCMRRIEVHPVPSRAAAAPIPRSLQVITASLAIQGADHMPGITLLEWRQQDLTRATIEYIRQRATFTAVSDTPADLVMTLTAGLSMISHGPYLYNIRLHADLGTAGGLIKTYDVTGSAAGSSVRWTKASDRDPIEAALQSSLEDLLTKIETDRPLYLDKEPMKGNKP